jgi:hypothetical protein
MYMDHYVKTLWDIEQIKKLKAQYCQYADSGEHADEFAELFLSDAVLDEGDDGVFQGREEIREMYKKIWPYFSLNQHLVFNPIIDIEGQAATGDWRLMQLCSTKHADGDKAFWAVGYYREKYTKIADRWFFAHVMARVHFCCPYEDGWAKTPFGELLSPQAMQELGL